jgi:hypothetical protein
MLPDTRGLLAVVEWRAAGVGVAPAANTTGGRM